MPSGPPCVRVRVLLTGASGFLGLPVAERLEQLGHEVHAIARSKGRDLPGVLWHEADVLQPGAIERIVADVGADGLVHLAWIAVPPAFWTSPLNLDWVAASLRLIRAFSKFGGKRVVVAGTCAEYGNGRSKPYSERDATQPQSLYATAKDALRRILHEYALLSGLEYAWGRVFFLYGLNEPPTKLLSSMIHDLSRGIVPLIHEPNRRLDFVCVRDAAHVIAKLIDGCHIGPVNIGSGKATSVKDAAKLIAACVAPHLIGNIEDIPQRCGSNDMLADVTVLKRIVPALTPIDVEIRRLVATHRP